MFPHFIPFSIRLLVAIFVILPFNILDRLTYLPYYLLKKMGYGSYYKKKHYILIENIHQFLLQPKNYVKKYRSIHRQIVKESEELKSN